MQYYAIKKATGGGILELHCENQWHYNICGRYFMSLEG